MRFFFLVLLALAPVSAAQDAWPQWRGPQFDGSSGARGLPLEWSAEKNVLWRTELPSWSGATPIVWGEHVFVMSPSAPAAVEAAGEAEEAGDGQHEMAREQRGQRGGRRRARRDPGGQDLFLLCLSTDDGRELWRRKLDSGNELHAKGNNASPSPVTDGETVWGVTGNGKVAALDMAGEVRWTRDLQADYGDFGHKWGYASSPLLLDDLLVVQVLHGTHTDDASYVLGLDPETGKTRWRVERETDAPRESPDAYTTPLPLGEGEDRQFVILGADFVTGHDPRTGKELWRVGGLNPRRAPNYRIVASPLFFHGVLVAPTRVRPLTAIAVEEDLRPTDDDVLWRFEGRGAPDVPSPTTDGTYLYLVDDGGMVSCLDPASGEVVWGPERTAQGSVSASPLLAEGRLYVTNEAGVTTVLATGDEYRELAVNETDGTYTIASLAACAGRIYLRTGQYLYCLGEE